MSKEFVWELEVNNDYKIFKCVVGDKEVVTYEDGVEKKHLKITNPVKKIGVLQIDTQTKVFGDLVPFRMENDTPYLLLENKWIMSDTTRDERVEKAATTYRRNSLIEICVGAAMLLCCLIFYLVNGAVGSVSILGIIGVMLVFAGVSTMIRLKQELSALVEAEKEKAEEKAAKKAAWAAERAEQEKGLKAIEAPAEAE